MRSSRNRVSSFIVKSMDVILKTAGILKVKCRGLTQNSLHPLTVSSCASSKAVLESNLVDVNCHEDHFKDFKSAGINAFSQHEKVTLS